ncbi:vasculin-like protein 1 isoform X1 [Coregonus clupeaformis]|uniref:vasculin-like protein 1 isoform X1 n=1 Tax=Coregonus clupeaformis TaxID=59861 RepID=UPI001BE0FA27|nr:vasculin-like protein 1 isoform X1 [Coregonus clupeaformis]XP_041705287.1 vasculin-like protein 1 isoform X1 [Coregonus clupeaformis]XP_041705288.1 vasculin-like protein 1 isoform X1 [Coregonus clupeaformis]XP_041705290.1 vasculin-like protein 1 isoform X1 [Coregonus clupeaformis]XP_041705291.1 vasculin-like protein 1 isoform X1 [Coregonus clupeaformis]
MAQHDFVPAWLNFSTPQPAKSHAAFERHGEHLARGDALPGVSRRRHNSSDGFFNNDPLRAPAGDGWHQLSLLWHDSVDSGMAKGGLGRGLPTWHTGTWGQERPQQGRHPKRPVGERERPGALRQCNGTFHPRRGPLPSNEGGQKDKLKFEEEGFPSLNPESSGKPVAQSRAVGTPVGVWEHPPGAKQTMTKMLVIKKVSKEDPGAAFSAGFANTRPHLTNSTKTPVSGPSVYKNLMTKPATAPTKTGPWKSNGRETKTSFNFSGQDSSFTNPAASVTKPLITSVTPSTHVSPKEPPSSITPPCLKLMHRSTDRKSEFLRGLKDERNGDGPTSTSPSATPESQENGGEVPENGISHSLSNTDTDHLSSMLEAEHRLLKAMGWQEYPENDVNFLPLTDEELKEFQDKTKKLKRNRLGQNGVLLKPFLKGLPLLLSWRNPLEPELEEVTETESTSSSQTSDDDADA